jgi:hypothetical protein
MINALVTNFNMAQSLAENLANQAYGKLSKDNITIDLSDLQLHGFIEHDVSLVHDDSAIGVNWVPNKKLVADMLTYSADGIGVTLADVVTFRAHRLQQCQRENPKLEFGFKEKLVAQGEVAFFMLMFAGEGNEGKVPLSFAESFLGKASHSVGFWQAGQVLFNIARTRPRSSITLESKFNVPSKQSFVVQQQF